MDEHDTNQLAASLMENKDLHIDRVKGLGYWWPALLWKDIFIRENLTVSDFEEHLEDQTTLLKKADKGKSVN